MGKRRPSQRAAQVQAVPAACARHASQSSRTSCHSTVLCSARAGWACAVGSLDARLHVGANWAERRCPRAAWQVAMLRHRPSSSAAAGMCCMLDNACGFKHNNPSHLRVHGLPAAAHERQRRAVPVAPRCGAHRRKDQLQHCISQVVDGNAAAGQLHGG